MNRPDDAIASLVRGIEDAEKHGSGSDHPGMARYRDVVSYIEHTDATLATFVDEIRRLANARGVKSAEAKHIRTWARLLLDRAEVPRRDPGSGKVDPDKMLSDALNPPGLR